MTPISTACARRPTLPVGKIVCVGRNYAAHAAEMRASPPPEPILFLKPPTALHLPGRPIVLPSFSQAIEHEVELVARIGEAVDGAGRQRVDAVAVGLDLTARDLQTRAKERGEPWAVAKGFDGAAPISELSPLESLDELSSSTLSLDVNGTRRQHAPISEMLFGVAELVYFVATRMRWQPGDLLFTGTPGGVGRLEPGDTVRAELSGFAALETRVEAAP